MNRAQQGRNICTVEIWPFDQSHSRASPLRTDAGSTEDHADTLHPRTSDERGMVEQRSEAQNGRGRSGVGGHERRHAGVAMPKIPEEVSNMHLTNTSTEVVRGAAVITNATQ